MSCNRLTLVCLLFVLSPFSVLAQIHDASSFKIKGNILLENDFLETSNAQGKDFRYSARLEDAPESFAVCISGQVCDGSAMTGDAVQLRVFTIQVPLAWSLGILQGVHSGRGANNGMTGLLSVTYNFSFITPSGDQFLEFTAPVTVSGPVTALDSNGQELWTVNLSGTGTADLSGDLTNGVFQVRTVSLHYTGQGSSASR